MGMLQAGIIPVTPFQQNCTIFFDPDTKEGVVIDPGGDVPLILQAIAENGLTIKEIWLTHGHLDHAGGASELKEALGVDVVGPHQDDLPLLQRVESQAAKYGISGLRNVVPDRWLKDGDKISFGAHEFEVYHTPGHAPGHVIYFNRAQNFAHLGDVLFNGSIGRTDLPGGDHPTLLASIQTHFLSLPDSTVVYSGHGPETTIGVERLTNPWLTGSLRA